jgi:protein SCO1/2
MPNRTLPRLLRIRRLAPLLIGAAVLTGATLVLAAGARCFAMGSPDLAGTSLGRPAPDFRLIDASGAPVSLASLRGKAVALTFLYTSCPDVCPLTAEKFREVHDELGEDAAHAALVAITVDPETDTPARIEQYSEEMKLVGKWEFLTGTREQLAPVWSAYYVEPLASEQAIELAQTGPASARSDSRYLEAHSLLVYVIDPEGKERRLLGPDFTAGDLTRDLRALIAGT